jgi:hypothetical protein
VENIMAKGERHELPLELKQDATLLAMEIKALAMEIKEPQTEGTDRIEDDIVHARMKEATSTTVPTEMVQDSITGTPEITPLHGECDTDYSDDAVDQINDVEQYISATVQTTPQSEGKTKGPQTRLRQRVNKACHNWTPITVSNLDEMDKTPKKSEGLSARRRRSTKLP